MPDLVQPAVPVVVPPAAPARPSPEVQALLAQLAALIPKPAGVVVDGTATPGSAPAGSPQAVPAPSLSFFARLLASVDLNDPGSRKRTFGTIAISLLALGCNMLTAKLGLPAVPDSVIIAVIGMWTGWLMQSGFTKAKAKTAGEAAALEITTASSAAAEVNR